MFVKLITKPDYIRKLVLHNANNDNNNNNKNNNRKKSRIVCCYSLFYDILICHTFRTIGVKYSSQSTIFYLNWWMLQKPAGQRYKKYWAHHLTDNRLISREYKPIEKKLNWTWMKKKQKSNKKQSTITTTREKSLERSQWMLNVYL